MVTARMGEWKSLSVPIPPQEPETRPKDMIHFLSSLASFQPSRTVPSVSRHPPYGRLKGVDEGNDRSRAERETDGGLDSLSFISLDPPNGTWGERAGRMRPSPSSSLRLGSPLVPHGLYEWRSGAGIETTALEPPKVWPLRFYDQTVRVERD